MLASLLDAVPDGDLPEVVYHAARCLRFGISTRIVRAAGPTAVELTLPPASLRILDTIERLEGDALDHLPEPVRQGWIDKLDDAMTPRTRRSAASATIPWLEALRSSERPVSPISPARGDVAHPYEEPVDQEITIITKTFNEKFQLLLGNAEVAVRQLQDHLRSVQQAVSSLGVQLRHVTRPGVSAEVHPAHWGPAPAVGNKTILVLEDAPDLLRLIRNALTQLGHSLVMASTSEEAMRQFKDSPAIDLLIADVQMPGLTGPQDAAILRRLRSDLPVLYISGAHEATVRGNVGRDPYLLKPFSMAALVSKVREVFQAIDGPSRADARHS